MDNKDRYINDSSYEKLLHNKEYYQAVFKKTEKVVSVVFYILNNIEIEKKSETHTSNLASKAHFTHENALRTLDAKPATSKEVLEQFAQSLIGLESAIRVAMVAGVIPNEAQVLLSSEISSVLHNVSSYIDNKTHLSDLLAETNTATPRATRPPSTRRTGVLPGSSAQPTSAPTQQDRRTRIKTILEAKGDATIKDIAEIVTDVSEKTIQRELNAMIEDNLVKREGERRWSKYSLA